MQQMVQRFSISGSVSSGTTRLKTTLYELIETINEEIKPGEENWVPLIVDYMLCSSNSVLSIAENNRQRLFDLDGLFRPPVTEETQSWLNP